MIQLVSADSFSCLVRIIQFLRTALLDNAFAKYTNLCSLRLYIQMQNRAIPVESVFPFRSSVTGLASLLEVSAYTTDAVNES